MSKQPGGGRSKQLPLESPAPPAISPPGISLHVQADPVHNGEAPGEVWRCGLREEGGSGDELSAPPAPSERPAPASEQPAVRGGGDAEENRGASRGGRGLNARIGGTRAPPRSPRPAPQHPNSRRAGAARGAGRGRMDGEARGFTCDGPGPAVELHRVIERRGHRVQDAARLRVQEPHRGGGQREPAAGGESGDPGGAGQTSTAAAEGTSGSRGPL